MLDVFKQNLHIHKNLFCTKKLDLVDRYPCKFGISFYSKG